MNSILAIDDGLYILSVCRRVLEDGQPAVREAHIPTDRVLS